MQKLEGESAMMGGEGAKGLGNLHEEELGQSKRKGVT